jgi:molecular chaperone GrpE
LDLSTLEEGVEVTTLREELEEAKSQIEEYYSRLQRLQADFENYKRRTKVENEEFLKYASIELIRELLEVSDNLERAIESMKTADGADGLAEGMEMIRKQFCEILNRNGVTAIKAVGEQFNPYVHEAIMNVISNDYPNNEIIEEFKQGYKLYDKVIRPSVVKVSKRS